MSEGAGVGPLVDEAKLGKILSNLDARGVTVVRGDAAASILDHAGANAAYVNWFGKPHLYLRDSVTRGQLVEELLHHGQSLRRGHAASEGGVAMQRLTYLDEIAAQKYMINHATRKGWTQAEISHYQSQLLRWQELLDDLDAGL